MVDSECVLTPNVVEFGRLAKSVGLGRLALTKPLSATAVFAVATFGDRIFCGRRFERPHFLRLALTKPLSVTALFAACPS